MAQHDMDVANQTFSALRSDLNAALQALVSNNSGATAPATTFAYQWWADTTSGILKQRNAANSAWINVLNMATGVPTGAAASGANSDITSLTALAVGGVPNGVITPAKLSQPFTSGTSVATTSGTAIDFTSIPSWVKRITVSWNGVSTNGGSSHLVQIGSGSVDTAGYSSFGNYDGNNGSGPGYTATNGFLGAVGHGATSLVSGIMTLTHIGGNVWVSSFMGGYAAGNNYKTGAGGTKTALSGALDRIRFTTVSGDTFDAGSINIFYE